jgi:anionic cell wall polymer biosynthesis LytR-Cps2A-Psr (LCP) family protein
VDEVDHFAPINLIYLAAYETATGNDEKVRTRKATEMLAQAILDEFEFVPDKYINVNGDAFIQLVDIFEVDGEKGIQIDLTGYGPVNGDPEGHGYFPGEVQILDGQDTLDFVRILYPDGVGPDYAGRFERQKIVILALMDAILNFDELDKVDDLLKEARKMVITDLSVDQVRDLACMVEAVDGEAEFIEVSTEEVTVVTTEVIDGVTTEVAEEKSLAYFDGEDRLIPDVEAIKAIIQEMGSGQPE